MKELLKAFWNIWKENYIFRTLASSFVSSVIGLLFIIFNGAIGVIYSSLWHGTICVYYILLTSVRGIIVFCQRKENQRHETEGRLFRTKVSRYTHVILFILNISLVVPISIMIKGERAYEYGLIPAIAMAAYIFYKIAVSGINLKKAKRERNCLIRELRVINVIDTLVAVLTLQNALIIAKGGMNNEMRVLLMYIGAGVFAAIVFITMRSMVRNIE